MGETLMFEDIDDFMERIETHEILFQTVIRFKNGDKATLGKKAPYKIAKGILNDLRQQWKDPEQFTVDTAFGDYRSDEIQSITIEQAKSKPEDEDLTDELEGITARQGLLPPYMTDSKIAVSKPVAEDLELEENDKLILEWHDNGEKHGFETSLDNVGVDEHLDSENRLLITKEVRDKLDTNTLTRMNVKTE